MSDKNQINQKVSRKLSWAIFLITISFVITSLISVVFPALIVRTVSSVDYSPVNPWETGPLAAPLIITNIILLGIGIAYFKNKLPTFLTKIIKFIFNFEVSKKVALVTILILLGIYVSFSVGELGEVEKGFDFPRVLKTATNWDIDDPPKPTLIRLFLLSSSIDLFDNIRVIPYIATIALVILTYFITIEISKKRFAGLVSIAILLQSFLFLKYDTRATYENFWTLFYIFSLYLIYKAWPFSSISFVLSLLSKALTILFLPMTLFFIYSSNLPRKRKIYIGITYLIIIVIGLGVITFTDFHLKKPSEFDNFYFWQGFTSVAASLRFDYLIILFLLPLTVGLFLASRRGIVHADSMMILIAGILFSAPLLTGFTDLTNQPYRFIPLVVFFAMGVGTILSKKE